MLRMKDLVTDTTPFLKMPLYTFIDGQIVKVLISDDSFKFVNKLFKQHCDSIDWVNKNREHPIFEPTIHMPLRKIIYRLKFIDTRTDIDTITEIELPVNKVYTTRDAAQHALMREQERDPEYLVYNYYRYDYYLGSHRY